MQPYLFPYIGYFQLINAVDKFVMYDDVNYIKKGWINRNNILINGKANMFTIPLKEVSQNKLINEIYLSDDTKWRISFLKTIEMNYKKAPLFTVVFPLIEKIINAEVEKINHLVNKSLELINEYIGINTIIVPSSDIYSVAHLKGQERILAICKKENARHYINPNGGKEIYSVSLFEQEGIKLNFIETNQVVYKQFNNEFVPWLSIIDLLMFNTKDEITVFLNSYKLV